MPERLDLPYAADGDARHRYDLFTPAGAGPWPLMVFIHGGGWHKGDRDQWHPICRHVAGLGWAAASVGYRLVPAARHPGQRADVAAALAHFVAHAAELGLDPRRTVLQGSSAGGWLALDAAIAPPAGMGLRGIVAYCPVVVLEPQRGFVQGFLGDGLEELRRSEDLAARIGAGYPEVLYLQGDADRTTPLPLAEAFCAGLRGRGNRVDLRVFPGIEHGFGYGVETPAQRLALAAIDPFLARLAR